MQYLRNLLFLILVGCSFDLVGAPQVQNQPTSWIYVQQASSYDAMNRDTAGAALNGQNGKNVAHLGAKFSGVYVDQGNAFGLYAWDEMLTYGNGAALNGLDLGFGYWPQLTNSTAYVDLVNAFPALVWDQLTNYNNGAALNGLNGGNDNGASAQWNGPYVELCADPPPSLALNGGLIVAATTVMGYDTILMSFDGTDPTGGSQGAVSSIAFASWPPSGVWTYDGTFALPVNCTIKASQGHGLNGFCGITNSGALRSFGQTWSNNVVVNGGANPSTTTVAALNVFGAALNNAQVLNLSVGANPSIVALNMFAPDSLTAALTPQIYWKGSQPWANVNFVGGDLSVNGLTGNGTTKYLSPTLPMTTASGFQTASSGFSVYGYTLNPPGGGGNAALIGLHDSSPANNGFTLYVNNTPQVGSELWGFVGAGDNTLSNFGLNGFYSGQRTSSTSLNVYFANSGNAHASIANNTTAQTVAVSAGGFGVYIFAMDGAGTPVVFSAATISFASFNTTGFSSATDALLYSAVQTCRTSLGGGFR